MQVLTYNGTREDKDKCRLISGIYYIVGERAVKESGDCFKMSNGRYATLANNNIDWDHSINEYNFKKYMTEGYISNKELGYFSQPDGNLFTIIDDSIREYPFVGFEPKYDIYSGRYYANVTLSALRRRVRKAPSEKMYKGFDQSGVYNYRDLPSSIRKKMEKGANEQKPKIDLDDEINKGLRGLSVGVEIETSWCGLQDKHLYNYGFSPVRDGSIQGNEFVSSPAFDINGIRNIYHFMNECNKATQVDPTTSFHVHIGSIKVDDEKKFLVDLYNNYYNVQNEINQLVPYYKRDYQWLRSKNKDHCRQLAYPVKDFNQLFCHANDFHKADSICSFETRRHVRQDRPKYEWSSRYYVLNYSNYVFHSQKTVEFRYHHGTVNPNRGLNWILIVAAITNCTIDQIQLTTLTQAINHCYESKLAKRLLGYIKDVKAYYQESYYKGNDGREIFKKEGIQF